MDDEKGIGVKVIVIEGAIYTGIDMAFGWFKKNNPALEIICDKKTMKEWDDFVSWCYAMDGEDSAKWELKENPEFDFEISPLMQSVIDECAWWWCKYNCDHQGVAEDEFYISCENCDGTGFLDEDWNDYCEECDGSGRDQEDNTYYDYLDQAYKNIRDSVDTKKFKNLSKIKI